MAESDKEDSGGMNDLTKAALREIVSGYASAAETEAAVAVGLHTVVSHPELVKVAAKWLARKCAVVLTELATIGETPDAIGWQGTHSTLIECKSSRADFLADASKYFRRESSMGIGFARYFLTVPGIIKESELPDKWGLLELTGSKVCVVRKSEYFEETNHRHEIGILLSTIRRIGQNEPKGVSIKFYTIESKNTATLGVASMANAEVRRGPDGKE